MNRTRKEFIVDSLMLGAAGGLAGCSTLEAVPEPIGTPDWYLTSQVSGLRSINTTPSTLRSQLSILSSKSKKPILKGLR